MDNVSLYDDPNPFNCVDTLVKEFHVNDAIFRPMSLPARWISFLREKTKSWWYTFASIACVVVTWVFVVLNSHQTVRKLLVAFCLHAATAASLTRTVPTWLAFATSLVPLAVTSILQPDDVLSGLVEPGIAAIVPLCMLGSAVSETRVFHHVMARVARANRRGDSQQRTAKYCVRDCAKLFFAVTAMSSVLNNTPIVAAILPTLRHGTTPGRLGIVMSVAGLLGGTLTLIGTSTNLMAASLASSATELGPGREITMFSFTLPALAFTVAVATVTLACFTLYSTYAPLHTGSPSEAVPETSRRGIYVAAIVQIPKVGAARTLAQYGLRKLRGAFVAAVLRAEDNTIVLAPSKRTLLCPGDRVLVAGDNVAINGLKGAWHDDITEPGTNDIPLLEAVRGSTSRVILDPDSELVGQSLSSVRFAASYGAVVLAVERKGNPLVNHNTVALQGGDALVCACLPCRRHEIGKRVLSHTFASITDEHGDSTDTDGHPVQEQDAKPIWHAIVLWVAFALTILLPALNIAHIFTSSTIAILVLITLGAIDRETAYRAIDLRLVCILVCSVAMARAASRVDLLSALSLSAFVKAGGYQSSFVLYTMSALFTCVINNNAAVAIVFPLLTASVTGSSIRSSLCSITLGASSAFVSPFGYQTNLMVASMYETTSRDWLILGGTAQIAGIATGPLFCSVLLSAGP